MPTYTDSVVETAVATLGVHVAAGTLWLAPVAHDGTLVNDRVDRFELAGSELTEERRLAELEESLEALLRRLGPRAVALLNAGKTPRPPSPSDSRRRGWLEAALMIAAARTACAVMRVTHDAVEKEAGVRPSDKEFRKRMAERLPSATPARWSDRAPAYGAAIVALGSIGG
jgi:hypothetical protein